MTDLGLAGKRAIVTGGAAGIGAAIGQRLAAEGVAVALLDVDLAAAEETARAAGTAGSRVVALRCDVRSMDEVRTAVADAVGALGGLDIVVNNAGIVGRFLPLAEYPEDDFVQVVDINLLGAYRVSHVAAPHLLAEGWGRIVNMASISGKEGNPHMTAYAASKAGMVGMTKAMGKELATTGVTVNCVAPGGVADTELMAGTGVDPSSVQVTAHPMERLARPDEVAAMVTWLCSTEASYSTGAVFDISGGRASY